ncbi:hypothetical protein QQZ08_010266 [Neonectria magnoliae]|uniref:Deacetylase sirtuin-type domain-containing protein n=1 Tax=Neonectria magnoliae TaxID=2732573 RepID=A0ABR1HI23_9HYPO
MIWLEDRMPAPPRGAYVGDPCLGNRRRCAVAQGGLARWADYLLNTIQAHWSSSCSSPCCESTSNSCARWASELVRQSPSRLEYLNPFLPPLLLSSFLVLVHQSSLASTSPTILPLDQLRPYITTNVQANASVLPPRRLTCFHFSNNLLGKLAKRADAVNAFLAYSRGQLALAPYTNSHESYNRDGSAMPFPDCVFLWTYLGSDLAHELAQPVQEPSFVFPPDTPNLRLPDGGPDVSISSRSHPGDLKLLNKKLYAKKSIIIISGAGISTNAGIPDYQSSSRSKKSSRIVYDASAYSTPESADTLHADVLQKLRSGRKAPLTLFDTFAERLAQSDPLRYHYTQNIDYRQTRLPYLSQRTIWLYGRADTLVCHIRPSHTI